MNEIRGYFPAIPPNECDALLWRSIVDICNENDLAFMIGEGVINVEAAYSTGTVNPTNGSAALVGVGTVWDPAWQGRKISIAGGAPYTVTINGALTATLDRPYVDGVTTTGLKYVIYRDVYPLPSDCEFSKDALLFDPLRPGLRIAMVDYMEFRRTKRQAFNGVVPGIPCEVARIGMTSAGLAQIEFGPQVPSAAQSYLLDYYRSPQKPAAITNSVTPIWPEAFEDVKVLRALWKYADRKGHARRFEWQKNYKDRIWLMTTAFDGGNEMRRRLRNTRARAEAGINVFAGNYAKV